MRKAFLALSLVATLSACSFGSSSNKDFATLYHDNIQSQISTLDSVANVLGAYQKQDVQ